MNNPRPSGVTLIGFLGALGALIGLFTAMPDLADVESVRRSESHPGEARAEQLSLYADAGVNLLACYFMLKARNWARWLFIAWNSGRLILAISLSVWPPLDNGINCLCFQPWMIATCIALVVAPFLLFRAAGQEYFANGIKPWWRE